MTARPLSRRWLAIGGAVVLAGVVAIAVLLRSSACATPPTTSPQKGKATYYEGGAEGHCSIARPADDLYVALGRDQYTAAAACGGYLDVTGPKGTVRVKVFDSCPACETGHLDLSRTAYRRIGNQTDGTIPITYQAVRDPRTPGRLNITFLAAASRRYWAVVIDNHANPLKSVKAKGRGGRWKTATHTDYNAWIISQDVGNGPYSVQMTDIYGHTGTATKIKLLPDKHQTTRVDLTAKESCD